MARIKIVDLPQDLKLTQKELSSVVGGASINTSNLLKPLGSNCGVSFNGGGAIGNLGNNCGVSYNGGGAVDLGTNVLPGGSSAASH